MQTAIRKHAPLGVRRCCLGMVLPPCRPQRCAVKARGMHSRYNDMMAEREVEYLYDDDEFVEDESDEDEEASSGMGDGLPPGACKLLLAVAQRMYTTPWLPDSYVGSVSAQRIEGKGCGLIAMDQIAEGELLLVCTPLAYVTSPTADAPPMAALMDKLRRGRFSFAARQAFEALYDGSNDSSSSKNGSRTGSRSGRDDGNSRGSSNGSSSKGGHGTRKQPRLAELVQAAAGGRPRDGKLGSKLQLQLPEERLQQIVALNAFGDHCQDSAVAACRGEQLQGLLGIWPAYALINHSCIPNAAPMIVGLGSSSDSGAPAVPRLLVRATRDIVPGEEVCVSYLGREVLAPLGFRREELLGSYGFACRCPRCRAEASLGDGMAEFLEELYEAAPELRHRAVEALQAGDMALLRQVDAQVSSLLARLDRLVAEAGLAPMLASWIRTAALDMFELAAACRMELEPQAYRSFRSLALAVELVGGTLPGSDLHTLLSARFHSLVAARYGAGSERGLEALQLSRQAHKLRYGPLDMAHMRTLTQASAAVVAARGDGGGTELLPPAAPAAALPAAGETGQAGPAESGADHVHHRGTGVGNGVDPTAATSSSDAAGSHAVGTGFGAFVGGIVPDEGQLMRERLERLALSSGGEVLDESDPRAQEMLQQLAAAQQERERQQQQQEQERQAQQQLETHAKLQQQQVRASLLQLQLQREKAAAGARAASAAPAIPAAPSDSGSSSSAEHTSSPTGKTSSSATGTSKGHKRHKHAADAAAMASPQSQPSTSLQATPTDASANSSSSSSSSSRSSSRGGTTSVSDSSSSGGGARLSAAAIASAALRKAKERRRQAASERAVAAGSSAALASSQQTHFDGGKGVASTNHEREQEASTSSAAAVDTSKISASTSSNMNGDSSSSGEELTEGAGGSSGLQPGQYSSLLQWMQHKDAAAAEATAQRVQRRRGGGMPLVGAVGPGGRRAVAEEPQDDAEE